MKKKKTAAESQPIPCLADTLAWIGEIRAAADRAAEAASDGDIEDAQNNLWQIPSYVENAFCYISIKNRAQIDAKIAAFQAAQKSAADGAAARTKGGGRK